MDAADVARGAGRGLVLALGVFAAVGLAVVLLQVLLTGQLPPPPPRPGRLDRLEPLGPAPALAAVVALLAYYAPLLKLGAAGLYTRLARGGVLDHERREALRRLLEEEPGIHAQEVRARLGVAWGTAAYHLRVLERSGIATSWLDGRYKRFALAGALRAEDRAAVATLRHPTARRLARAVAATPGVGQKQLRAQLRLASPSATWHLQRLERAGLVRAERRGREVRYRPGPAWEPASRHVRADR